jgi:hypothetical protein
MHLGASHRDTVLDQTPGVGLGGKSRVGAVPVGAFEQHAVARVRPLMERRY